MHSLINRRAIDSVYVKACANILRECGARDETRANYGRVPAKTRVGPMTGNDVAYPKDDASGSSRWSREAKPMTGRATSVRMSRCGAIGIPVGLRILGLMAKDRLGSR